jgi:hypothetical protein
MSLSANWIPPLGQAREHASPGPVLSALRQRGGETTESDVFGRQAEAQQILGPFEVAAPDMLSGQRLVDRSGIGMPYQAKQRSATDNRKADRAEHIVQSVRERFECFAGAIGPLLVKQGRSADGQRRPRTGPRTESLRDALDHRRRTDGEAKAQSGEAVEFSE